MPYRYKNIQPYPISTLNNCVTKIDNKGQIEYLTDLLLASATFDDLECTYEALMDEGNTEVFIEQIQNNWSDDVWVLRSKLLEQSPYLSQTVLREVAKENLLPQPLYLEICLRNSDATKDLDFIDFLRNDIPSPLPDYMLSLIESSWTEQTVRTVMENLLSQYSSKRDFAMNSYIYELSVDSVDHAEEINELLARRGSFSDLLNIAENHIFNNNFTAAYDIIANITFDYHLTAEELTETTDFYDYIVLREGYYQIDKTVYDLDSLEINTLLQFVQEHSGRSKVLASNILCYIYHICIDDEISEKSGKVSNSHHNTGKKRDDKFKNFFIQVKPNPADTYCTFEWNFGDLKGTKNLKITDMTGKLIVNSKLSASQGQWIWDTRNLPSGNYVYAVYQGNTMLESGKVIVR